MQIGYARVSTSEQDLSLQLDALKKAKCGKVFDDIASGSKDVRSGMQSALNALREGDTLVVWRLDRLARSLKQLIEVVNDLKAKGIAFKSLQENIDTTTSGGKLVFHIFASLAQFERELIQERTKAGLMAARARGRVGGRPRKFDAKKLAIATKLLNDPELSVAQVCKTLGVSKATLYRHLSLTKA